VSLVTLGCARNEVDSEELAARLEAAGWTVRDASASGGGEADVVLVNTCGFIQAAKQESIDELLGAGSGGAKVVAAVARARAPRPQEAAPDLAGRPAARRGRAHPRAREHRHPRSSAGHRPGLGTAGAAPPAR